MSFEVSCGAMHERSGDRKFGSLPLVIPELDLSVTFGKEPLRHGGNPTLQDLIAEAFRKGIGPVKTASVVARQMYIYNHPDDLSRRYNNKRDWRSLQSPIPFLVSQTSLAAFQHGVGENIDPRNFITNRRSYVPEQPELNRNGYTTSDLEIAKSMPAILAGSMTVTYFGYEDYRQTVLVHREGGYYQGMPTIPGGHYDSPREVAGLAEAKEEAHLASYLLAAAEPLGTIDQVVFVPDGKGSVKLQRYANLVWSTGVWDSKQLHPYDGGTTMIDEEVLRASDMTPLAGQALELVGYL